ncbi:MAG: cytochrome c family protein [Bacteroidales bacterium]|nr:cytochrome c family protein [Bacteroidales bacterium]
MELKPILFFSALLILITSFVASEVRKDQFGEFKYDDFDKPGKCKTCHNAFYQQWKQSMMSKAYTHHWDEIEYFQLAVAHSENDPEMAKVHEGCNGCHTPMAWLSGDVPPPKPEEGSRANESVSCEVCHLIKGINGDTAFNFNYIMTSGDTKYSSRKGETDSPEHKIVRSKLHSSAKFCGICHNEKSTFGAWVKSTQLEWEEGPYSKEGVQCQDCHMTEANSRTARMGVKYPDAKLHLFHGAHDPGKLNGVIELRVQPDVNETVPGGVAVFTVALFNQKTGHKFPTGSVEDRIVWLHVEAEDEKGNIYHLKVDKKEFEGEEYTIASNELAYQDMGVPLQKPDFKGVKREDVPVGDRIFRMPYFDPQGRMTLMQWNTKSLGVDYRIGPRETKLETFTFNLPYEVAPGKLKVTAVLNYRLLVKPVGEFLNVPEEEYAIHEINRHSTEITVLP